MVKRSFYYKSVAMTKIKGSGCSTPGPFSLSGFQPAVNAFLNYICGEKFAVTP